METGSIRQKPAQALGGRRQATAIAKAKVIKSDVQDRLAELGGFVWKVDMWPNWLQIHVDRLGNNHMERREGEEVADIWTQQNEAKLQEIFADVLGPQFGELAILGSAMGPEPHRGNCCRAGCGGCLNGAHNKMMSKIQGPADPVDRLG